MYFNDFKCFLITVNQLNCVILVSLIAIKEKLDILHLFFLCSTHFLITI